MTAARASAKLFVRRAQGDDVTDLAFH